MGSVDPDDDLVAKINCQADQLDVLSARMGGAKKEIAVLTERAAKLESEKRQLGERGTAATDIYDRFTAEKVERQGHFDALQREYTECLVNPGPSTLNSKPRALNPQL